MSKETEKYNSKDILELEKALVDKRKELLEAKIELSQGKAKDVHRGKKLKREIARILTFMRMKK